MPKREDSIKMDLQKLEWGDVDSFALLQDRERWRVLVSAVMNRFVPSNAENFSTG